MLQEEAVQRLQETGKWLKVNGEAIYNTRITEHYRDGNTFFTKKKTGELLYALVCLPENEPLPAAIEWRNKTSRLNGCSRIYHRIQSPIRRIGVMLRRVFIGSNFIIPLGQCHLVRSIHKT
jgi:alpha-L-fucosidase